jgi:hypothetical protein
MIVGPRELVDGIAHRVRRVDSRCNIRGKCSTMRHIIHRPADPVEICLEYIRGHRGDGLAVKCARHAGEEVCIGGPRKIVAGHVPVGVNSMAWLSGGVCSIELN